MSDNIDSYFFAFLVSLIVCFSVLKLYEMHSEYALSIECVKKTGHPECLKKLILEDGKVREAE